MATNLNQIEQRMAFYAGLLKDGKLTLNDEDAEEWRKDLPMAIQGQYICLDRGDRPVKMSLANVRALKTLALSNA
jgi:hypothetical protein